MIRWSAAIRILRSSSQKTVSEGEWPGRCSTCSVRSRSSSVWPSRSGRVTFAFDPQARNAEETGLERAHDLVGDAVAPHHASRELVVARGVLAVVLGEVGELVDRGHLGARVGDDDVDQPEVVDVLVGEDHQLDVLERAAALGELVLELVEGASGVGPRVDQRERVVLDQVGVDAADRERGGDPQQVDARLGGARKRRLGGERRAQERISARTSSVRASISSWLNASRFRRRRGSVFDGRTLKCHVAAVDRDAVEPASPRRRSSAPAISLDLRVRVVRPWS